MSSSSVFPTHLSDGVLRVTVSIPRLDAAVAREFKSGVESAWTPGLARVEIDLGAVEFVDSSGVGALISLYRRLPAGGGLTLVAARPAVRSMLELLRLNDYFELVARDQGLSDG